MSIIVQIIQKTYSPCEYSSAVNLRPYFPMQFDNSDEVEKFLRDKGFIPSLDEGIWEKSEEGYKEIIAWVGRPLEGGNMVPMLCSWNEGHEE